jgi:cell division protein FtsL
VTLLYGEILSSHILWGGIGWVVAATMALTNIHLHYVSRFLLSEKTNAQRQKDTVIEEWANINGMQLLKINNLTKENAVLINMLKKAYE